MPRASDAYPQVDVLLATYNGARFLSEQIESILSQDYPCFRVVAHDDGSSDETVAILKRYAAQVPDRFIVLEDGVALRSACHNFFHLLAYSTAALVTFADQDDVWLPGRISKLVARFDADPSRPAGVYCDLRVVDETLEPLAASAWNLQGTPTWVCRSVVDLAPGNCVTGCAFMMNAAARERILARPRDRAVMHDHFSALCILLDGGSLTPVPEPLVLYRQHGANQIGAVRMLTVRELVRVLPKKLDDLRLSHLQALQAGLQVSFSLYFFWAVRTVLRRRHGSAGSR